MMTIDRRKRPRLVAASGRVFPFPDSTTTAGLRLSPSSPPPTGLEQENDGSQADSKRRPGLSRKQGELHDALVRVDPRLGPIYAGGLRVLEDDSNPDRLAQSAHSMRELMEKIEQERLPPVEAQLGQIRDQFLSGRERSPCHSKEFGWAGEIDPQLSTLLDRLGAFFDWFAEVRPRRRELFESMLGRLDRSGLALPAPLVGRTWKRWKEIRGFFVGVSHHGKDTDLATLRNRIADFEVFLSDRLLPRTSAELDAIDAIIEEARDA